MKPVVTEEEFEQILESFFDNKNAFLSVGATWFDYNQEYRGLITQNREYEKELGEPVSTAYFYDQEVYLFLKNN